MTESLKKRIAVHFAYSWHLYFLSAILIIIFWTFMFSNLDKVSQTQQMNIFLCAASVDKPELEQKLHQALKTENIREVNVDHCALANTSSFEMVFSTRGVVHTDIIIVPEGIYPESCFQTNFASFDPAYIEPYFPTGFTPKYLEYSDNIFGIRVYDAETKSNLLSDSMIDFSSDDDKDYYLFFNKESDNIGELSAGSKNDCALTALKYMLNLNDGE